MKHLLVLLLFGASCFFAQGQEKKNLDLQEKELELENRESGLVEDIKPEIAKPIKEFKEIKQATPDLPFKVIEFNAAVLEEERPPVSAFMQAKTPEEKKAVMIKQVLGEVYTEVEHIPEPQWFEMEPIAEVYVDALFKARTMADDEAASQLVADAKAAFDTAINAKLTADQKKKMQQKKQEFADDAAKLEKQFKLSLDCLQEIYSKREISNKSQTIIQVDFK